MSEQQVMRVLLTDQAGGLDAGSVEVAGVARGGVLELRPAGYGDHDSALGQGSPVMLELYDGKLRVVVWDNISQDAPGLIADLDWAREDRRLLQERAEHAGALLRDLGGDWARVTGTDPSRVDPPTEAEVQMVEDCLLTIRQAVGVQQGIPAGAVDWGEVLTAVERFKDATDLELQVAALLTPKAKVARVVRTVLAQFKE